MLRDRVEKRTVKCPRKPEDAEHKPRYQYDCGRCKFSWCCGYSCGCVADKGGKKLPEPPRTVKIKVNRHMLESGLGWERYEDVPSQKLEVQDAQKAA